MADWKFDKKKQAEALYQATQARESNQGKVRKEPLQPKKRDRGPKEFPITKSIFEVPDPLTYEQAKKVQEAWNKNANYYANHIRKSRANAGPQGAQGVQQTMGTTGPMWTTTNTTNTTASGTNYTWGTGSTISISREILESTPKSLSEPVNERTCMWCAEAFDTDEALEEHEDGCGA